MNELKQVREEKLQALIDAGCDPYPTTVKRTHTVENARASQDEPVEIAGRIMAIRGHGKIFFLDVQDESGKIQAVFKMDAIPQASYELLEYIDIGDFLAVQGKVGKTQAGEISVFVTDFQIISKSLRPLPDQWYGFKDVEERYRKRYLDMLLNPSVKQTLDSRFTMERAIRTFLWGQGYTEVETPVLQPLYGGTNAKPFSTHMNALDAQFYLRVAPELYLKRLIVGGYERVFEIARNFRNEGIDLTHQPEFTMMEFYEAYADYHRIMDLTEELIQYAAQAVNKNFKLKIQDQEIDISGKWKRITIDEAMETYAGISWEKVTDKEAKDLLKQYSLTVKGEYTKAKALFTVFDHLVVPHLITPTWVIDYPRDVSPLSHAHRSKPGRVERFEGYVGGKEICDGWSEIISGLEQRQRFETEQRNMRAGDTEAQPLDEEFIEALEYGCPPLGGIGIGIDRLCMLLTNTWAIREVIAFPTLKAKQQDAEAKIVKEEKPASQATQKKLTDVGISYGQAQALLEESIKDPITRMHCMESEAIMRALARHFGENEEAWGILGLLHDIDWEQTKTDTSKHSLVAVEILKKAGMKEDAIRIIQSHVYPGKSEAQFMGPAEYIGKSRSTRIEHALAAAETLTGLIIATTLVQPEKQLMAVKPESLMKKYKSKGFAANCRRDIIAECEEIGLSLEEFLALGLNALQGIHGKLGF